MLGIFDSGLGGLTVVRAIERRARRVGFIYFGDTARLPYGTKSADTIGRYVLQALRFLHDEGATTPVVACHTASSVLVQRPAVRRAAEKLFDAEIFEVVTPAVAAARSATKNGRIGVLGTTATIHSDVYQRALSDFLVVPVAASVLVGIAEDGWGNAREIRPILQKILQPFLKANADTVILACTHFPLLKRQLRGILGPKVRLIDPGEELAQELAGRSIMLARGERSFFVTDVPQDFAERASRFLGRTVRIHHATLT